MNEFQDRPWGDEEQTPQKDTHFSQTGEVLDEQEFYCPGCGRRSEYRRECTGKAEAPHPPIEVVPTRELQGEEHTAAPSTENLG